MQREAVYLPDKHIFPHYEGRSNSVAVRVGDLLFVSGQISRDPKTSELRVTGEYAGIAAQTRQTLENLRLILEKCGTSMDNVAKTLIILADGDDFNEFEQVYRKYFKHGPQYGPPARSGFEASKL